MNSRSDDKKSFGLANIPNLTSSQSPMELLRNDAVNRTTNVVIMDDDKFNLDIL